MFRLTCTCICYTVVTRYTLNRSDFTLFYEILTGFKLLGIDLNKWIKCFYIAPATNVTYHQKTLTHPVTWLPTFGTCICSNVETNLSEASFIFGLGVSNIHRYKQCSKEKSEKQDNFWRVFSATDNTWYTSSKLDRTSSKSSLPADKQHPLQVILCNFLWIP